VDVVVALSCSVDITLHIIHLFRLSLPIFVMMSKNVICVLTYKQGHRHTLRICNNYCSSTATVVKGTRLNITLYVLSKVCRSHSDCSQHQLNTREVLLATVCPVLLGCVEGNCVTLSFSDCDICVMMVITFSFGLRFPVNADAARLARYLGSGRSAQIGVLRMVHIRETC